VYSKPFEFLNAPRIVLLDQPVWIRNTVVLKRIICNPYDSCHTINKPHFYWSWMIHLAKVVVKSIVNQVIFNKGKDISSCRGFFQNTNESYIIL
jgi:hypothetical protein